MMMGFFASPERRPLLVTIFGLLLIGGLLVLLTA